MSAAPAIIEQTTDHQAVQQANAAHIVKCVNMHDELVAYLTVCLDIFETDGTKGRVCSDIRETLKKAGAL